MPDDLRAIVEEIQEEARRTRQAPDYPADLERQLDALFEDLVPERVNEHDFEAVLDRAERASLIDLHAPIDDGRPLFAQVKKGVRKLVLWYMDYVVRQLATFAGATTRAVRILGERVERLEAVHGSLVVPVAGAGEEVEALLSERIIAPAWTAATVDLLSGAGGRVLHVEAADGSLVAALREARVDAYGAGASTAPEEGYTEPTALREQPALDHLRTVGEGALAGLVLSGFVDHGPRTAKLVGVGLAAGALADGGRLVVLATHPDAWATAVPAVVRDLAPGTPFHPDTWTALLERSGFGKIEVREAGDLDVPAGTYLLTAVRTR